MTFCNTNESNHRIDKTDIQEVYELDMKFTGLYWTAYKTNDKIPVSGHFDEFSCDRGNQEFGSIEEFLNGLKFSIKSSSSSSDDVTRDQNLKNYFFKYLTDNFEINGSLGRPINDSIDISFNILGQNKTVRFAYSERLLGPSWNVIQIIGTIDLVNQFDAIKAYSSIHERCIDLHKGSDGISKTWERVDVIFIASVMNYSNYPYFD